jgi:hypothetical protein
MCFFAIVEKLVNNRLKPFVAKPKPATVVEQDFDGRSSFISKNKAMPTEWIKL